MSIDEGTSTDVTNDGTEDAGEEETGAEEMRTGETGTEQTGTEETGNEETKTEETGTEEIRENNGDEEGEDDIGRPSAIIIKDPAQERNYSKLQSLVVVRGLPIVSPSAASLVRQEDADSKREVVKFASRFTAIAYPPEKDHSRMIKPIPNDMLTSWRKYMEPGTARNDSFGMMEKEYVTQFTQTFFKALTKVSNRRLIEILNMVVDYEDISLVFYCRSDELITNPRGHEEELETNSPE